MTWELWGHPNSLVAITELVLVLMKKNKLNLTRLDFQPVIQFHRTAALPRTLFAARWLSLKSTPPSQRLPIHPSLVRIR